MYKNKICVNTFSEARNFVLKTERDEFMMERKKKKNSSAYFAICCCALIVAIVGYANRVSLKESEEEKIGEIVEVTPDETVAETSQEAEVEVPDAEIAKESEKVQEEKPEVIEFTAPVSGKVIEEYSGDDLVYNEALKDWRAHSGVDFEAKIGEDVKAGANGIVESVFDSNMGRCVIIDHQNGFKTMYANLEETEKVKAGDRVMAGDVIGTVGNTALGDITDLEHVHFEMIKDGENVNPIEFLN